MGIIFTDKVEHRHGSKKVSRKTAKIEMKIKQEELKQLKQQRRQQQWADLQERVQQQQMQKQVQQQYVSPVQEIPTVNQEVNQEVRQQINQTTLEQLQEQQTRLTELLTYQQQLKAIQPKLTKLESFIVITMLVVFVLTLPTIIIPCLSVVISGCILNSLDTESTRHRKEVQRVNGEIKGVQKSLQELRKNLF